ncbi:MAG: hypothetical protein ABI478_06510 [Propionivibrio sp.]
MNFIVSRSDLGGRRLPVVGRTLYETQGASPAGKWLSKVARPTLGLVKLYSGFSLGPESRLGRLLFVHRLALEAECAGAIKRADFLWREMHVYLARLWSDQSVWVSAAIPASGAASTPTSGIDARDCLLRELFVDTHCAFYNARVTKNVPLDAHDRAFAHSDWLAALVVGIAAIAESDADPLLAPAARLRIEAFKRENRLGEAVLACESVLRYLPLSLEFQDELVDLIASSLSGFPRYML